MPEIKDQGKVWFPGTFRPVFALRVDETFFDLGCEEEDEFHYWIEQNYLCVDLHNKNKKQRIARRFRIDSTPTTPAALFNGFENTQHADVKVVTSKDEGVEEFVINGNEYLSQAIGEMERKEFWDIAIFH